MSDSGSLGHSQPLFEEHASPDAIDLSVSSVQASLPEEEEAKGPLKKAQPGPGPKQPPQQTGSSQRNALYRWVQCNPCKIGFLLLLVVASIVLVAVVPPVCVLRGCSAKHPASQANNDTNRLLVNFEDAQKSVKGLIPAVLWDYIDEESLETSGIKVVSFSDGDVMGEVRGLIERQPDLVNLLEDQALPAPPARDVLLAEQDTTTTTTIGSSNTSNSRRLQQQQSNNMARKMLQQLQANQSLPYPNDPMWSQLWHLQAINATGAWGTSTGAKDLVVAIIDTGCDLNHPDLKDNLWTNPREIPNNGIDDDGNGYVDDYYGYDFAGDCRSDWRANNNTAGGRCGGKPNPQDTYSHGTHCAGIVAAVGNNNIGVTGIAPRVKVMCLKVADPDGSFYTSHVIKAYDYALRMGAHIASCSFGPSVPNTAPTAGQIAVMRNETRFYETALTPLKDRGMLVVAAAGNENTDLNQLIPVNASYNPCTASRNVSLESNMLCVMATDPGDKRWFEILPNNQPAGSNYGSMLVDLGAPGRQVLSTVPQLMDNGYVQYDTKTGSSMATPLTAGVAALVMSVLGAQDGNYYKGAAVRQILLDSGDRLPGMQGVVKSASRINAARAMQAALQQVANVRELFPMSTSSGWDVSQQPAMVRGFTETYYAGSLASLGDQDWRALKVLDVSTRAGGVSRFDSYKWPTTVAQPTTVVINSTFYVQQRGLYGVRVRSSAQPQDVVLVMGYRTMSLRELSAGVVLQVSAPGYYSFELRYRNPSQTIDITFSTPDRPQTYDYLPANFLAAQAASAQPRTYAAPNMALSSVYQVLYSAVTNASVSMPPLYSLQLDQQYKYSTVVEDLAYGGGGDLQAALAMDAGDAAAANSSLRVVGIVHTRITAPSQEVAFRLTCQSCMLSINNMPVLDVYSPSPATSATSTRQSGCVQLASSTTPSTTTTANTTHDLTVRFAIPAGGLSAASMLLTWVPCTAGAAVTSAAPASVKPFVANPLFWRPSSGVAGYVGGMQCDVWPSHVAMTSMKTAPPAGAPYLKFRLPSAMAGSKTNILGSLNPLWAAQPCRPVNGSAVETFDRACGTSFSFFLRDVYSTLPSSPSQLLGQPLDRFYMRCWTYLRRGPAGGRLSPRVTTSASVTTLGSQAVFTQAFMADALPTNGQPLAPSVTSLNGYYQLLVYEARYEVGSSLVGLVEGPAASSTPLPVNFADTMLPIPGVMPPAPPPPRPPSSPWVVSSQQQAASPPPPTAAPVLTPKATPPPPKKSPPKKPPPPPPKKKKLARSLLQDLQAATAATNTSSSGGGTSSSSSWTNGSGFRLFAYSQVGQRYMRMVQYANNASAFYEAGRGFSSLAVNRLDWKDGSAPTTAAVASSPAVGLQGSLQMQSSPAQAGLMRYAVTSGFLSVPLASSSANAGTANRTVSLRVRPGASQCVSLTLGDVTVINGNECPTTTVSQYDVQMVLPAGMVPADVIVRTGAASDAISLDISVVDATQQAWPIDSTMWYASATSP